MQSCHICGNEILPASLRCPYCGSDQQSEEHTRGASRPFCQKSVNLEQGLPTVAQALDRLQREIAAARVEQVRLLTLIHGYGSSGKGGAIRKESRKMLSYLCQKGEVKEVVSGEEFHRRQGVTRQLLSRFPQLLNHPHLGRHNKGVTIVVVF